MSVFDFVNAPLATVLQNLCGRYLLLESDAETLALELRQRQVRLCNVLANTVTFNEELARFGLELRRGHVSQAELKVVDLISCTTSLELETVTLRVRPSAGGAMWTEGASKPGPSESEGRARLLSFGSLWQKAAPIVDGVKNWFTSNLTVTAKRTVINWEGLGGGVARLELENVEYTTVTSDSVGQETAPQLKIESAFLAFPGSRTEALGERQLALQNILASVDFTNERCVGLKLTVEAAALTVTPDLYTHLTSFCSAAEQGGDCEAAVDDATSVFYDAMDGSDQASTIYSDATESAFFDCEDSDPQPATAESHPVSFELEISRLNLSLKSSAAEEAAVFLLHLTDLASCGVYGDSPKVDLSIGRVLLFDQSSGDACIQRLKAEMSLPPTLRCVLSSHEDGSSFLQLGFAQLQQRACLRGSLHKRAQTFRVDVRTDPAIFRTSCVSIQKALLLFKAFKKERPNRSLGREGCSGKQLCLNWHSPGIFGSVEHDGEEACRLLFAEAKSDPSKPFVTFNQTSGSHESHHPSPTDVTTALVSMAEMSVYHCGCQDSKIVFCRQILCCLPHSEAPRGADAPLAAGEALVLEIRKVCSKRLWHSDLSTLAYTLVDANSSPDGWSFQERQLSTVEFETKALRSADLTCELHFGSLSLDAGVADMGACSDILFHFWQPSKMADQMKLACSLQSVLIISGHCCKAKVAAPAEAKPLVLTLDRLEICVVSGIERKTISTFAAAVNQVKAECLGGQERCCVGGQTHDDGPGLQFFQVSELDYRNAKFKQWAAFRQNSVQLTVSQDVLELLWIVNAAQQWLQQNKEHLQTDIEAETSLSFLSLSTRLHYLLRAPEESSGGHLILQCLIQKGDVTLQNLRRLKSKVCEVELAVGVPDAIERFLHDACIEVHLKPIGKESISEIRNQNCKMEFNTERLAQLIYVFQSLRALVPLAESDAMDVDDNLDSTVNLFEGILDNAFAADGAAPSSRSKRSRRAFDYCEEDVDGFVRIDDVSPSVRLKGAMRASYADWLDAAPVRVQEDYIHFPHHRGMTDSEPSPEASSVDAPPAAWSVRCVRLCASCCFVGSDPTEQVTVSAKDMNLSYSSFCPGHHYQDRWTASVQELEILDVRGQDRAVCAVERNRSQLRTEYSKRLNHQQTLSFPMFRATVETVLPAVEEMSTTAEKRVELHIVPLRLRLSQSLREFIKLYLSSLPSIEHDTSGAVYFQKCRVSALFVTVDYRPRRFNLDRLKNGRTSELANIIQWEGLEFLLNAVDVSGISGWENLFSFVVKRWTHDISSSQKHRMLGGFPALGILKRVSPAAQDVARAALSKVTFSEPAEKDIRGTHVAQSQSLYRALEEFGRVFSLEVLNLCANGAEGVQLVFEGADNCTDASSSRLQRARETLRRAAHSVVVEPIHSVRSGEGVGVAMTKALWATPRALLAPAAAAATVVHGALRSACDALDTDHVLDT